MTSSICGWAGTATPGSASGPKTAASLSDDLLSESLKMRVKLLRNLFRQRQEFLRLEALLVWMKDRDVFEYRLANFPFLHLVSVLLCDELELLRLLSVPVFEVLEEFEEGLGLVVFKLFEELGYVRRRAFGRLFEVEISER